MASWDLFVVPTATLRVFSVLVVLSHDRRRIAHVNVTASPTEGTTAKARREALDPLPTGDARVAKVPISPVDPVRMNLGVLAPTACVEAVRLG